MSYYLAHLDDRADAPWQESDPHEEIYVFIPGERVVTAVPIGALRHHLPLLHSAVEARTACCPGCGCELPGGS